MPIRPFAMCLVLLCSLEVRAAVPPAGEEARRLTHDIYQQLIGINTTESSGSCTAAAEAMAARLKAAGFPDEDVKVLVPADAPRKGNLVARLHGTTAEKPILLLAHLDVVEANREDWSLDPFVLTEKDGYYYGRGTGDDKAQAAIWLANLIQYKKEGFVPDRDLIVALTADEEGGGPFNGVDWLIKNHRDLIDAEFCLNEGGWGEIIDGKHVANYLQVSENYVMNFRLEVRNKGGHSSFPIKDNAIYHLAGALTRLADFDFPLKTNEVTSAYFRRMGELSTGPEKQDLLKVADGSQDAMQRVAALAPAFNATLRTTCVATQPEGGHAVNALPQLAAATVNCRVLPEDSPQYVEDTLKKVFADDQVSIKKSGDFMQGPSSPLRPDVLEAATRITTKMWPGVAVVPNMVMGATDGRSLRIAGIPTYGIQGIFIDRADVRFHGRDERIPVQSFYEGQAFLYDFVKALSSPVH